MTHKLSIKKLALKIEAFWWMSRPAARTSLLLPVMGWLSAQIPLTFSRLTAILMFMVIAKSAVTLLNDLLDEENDSITTPYLPLPAGLLSRREVIACIWFCFIISAVFLWFASSGIQSFIISISLMALGFTAGYLYSLLKYTGAFASMLISLSFSIAVVIGWFLAEGNNTYIIPVATYSFITGFSGNLLAALMDIDTDPLVGNQTMPVRIGSNKALISILFLNCISSAIVASLAVIIPGGANALPVLALALILRGISFKSLLDGFSEKDRGREQRLNDVRSWKSGSYLETISLMCVFSFPIGLIAGCIVWIISEISIKGYGDRIVNGHLRDELKVISE